MGNRHTCLGGDKSKWCFRITIIYVVVETHYEKVLALGAEEIDFTQGIL